MEEKKKYLKVSVGLPMRSQCHASVHEIRLNRQRFERDLSDGVYVASSHFLYGFEKRDGQYLCKFMDERCDEFKVYQADGDFFDPNTGDWVYWGER